MFGPTFPSNTPIQETINQFPLEELLEGPGIVDYVVGAVPSPGVFVLGTHDHPRQQHYLIYINWVKVRYIVSILLTTFVTLKFHSRLQGLFCLVMPP